MKMIELIATKKEGKSHTKEEIQFIVNGAVSGSIPDYQLSAWLMAVYFSGMDFNECAALTEAMANSGEILDLSEIGKYVVDKHSTGGVGDKITIILIPLLAAAGMPVAKLSGRGLGHTGGTIDKLESIPGFKTSLEMKEFISQIKTIGAAIASQTKNLTPADGKLYALRDVTSTVNSLPLIASSVVSKKIASGANVIVLDVKYGRGAFVKTQQEAEKLSQIMVEIGKRLNKSITAVITSMDQPLGNAVGNSLEIIESIEVLKNRGPKDVRDLTLYLGGLALIKAEMAKNMEDAVSRLEKHLDDGSALEKLKEIIIAQGGNADVIDDYGEFPTAGHIVEINSSSDGYVSCLDALKVAKACKILGAGRDKKDDVIDYSVGVVLNKKIGDRVFDGEIIARIYSNSEELSKISTDILLDAFKFSTSKPQEDKLIYKIIE
jgi:pyrimidine-nucleoside phosphorylase